MKVLVVLVAVLVSSCLAEDAASDSVPVDDQCLRVLPVDVVVDVEAIKKSLEAGELEAYAESSSVDSVAEVPVPTCENGPRSVIHTVPNEFHWPPIYRESCDRLPCRNPPCFVRKSQTLSRCVHVFKLVDGRWVYARRQIRKFENHLACGCKRCEDIKTMAECEETRPCPNKDDGSFCYWTPLIFTILPPTVLPQSEGETDSLKEEDSAIAPVPGICKCCDPVPCERPHVFVRGRCRCECSEIKVCPMGQMFNRESCECECPKGSKMNSQGVCVGDCEAVSLGSCEHVKCADNQHFSCKKDASGAKCVCPSCDDASAHQCFITNCMEQRTKPMCKYDYYAQKCRCPRCEDQVDQLWCERTLCSSDNDLHCRWSAYFHTCSCPYRS